MKLLNVLDGDASLAQQESKLKIMRTKRKYQNVAFHTKKNSEIKSMRKL
jgi:hypothetical protein